MEHIKQATELAKVQKIADEYAVALQKGVAATAKVERALEELMIGFRRVRSLRRSNRKREAWDLAETLMEGLEILAGRDRPDRLAFQEISKQLEGSCDGN